VNRSVPVISITKETISINDKSLKVIDLGNITHTEIKVIGNMVGLVIHTQSGETKNTIEIGLNPVAANPEELIAVIQARVKAAKARVAL
jgi:glycine betaine/choline ABC-type transport system substrate-binding protein